MTSEQNCFVHIVLPGATEFVPAGRFQLSESPGGARVGRFVYALSYLKRSNAVALDPVQLRLAQTPFETARLRGIFGAIRDAMPDSWGRRVIERRHGGVTLDDFRYLMEGADDRAGALAFSKSAEPPLPVQSFPSTIHLAELQAAADATIAGEPVPRNIPGDQLHALFLQGTSMGGARPKAMVEHDSELWLAKFGHPDDRWNDPRVEHGLLTLAKQCGIRVAESRVEKVGGRDVVLVRRFDRKRADRGYYRHRMISALTALQADSSASGRERWSYLLFADEIRRASAAGSKDLRELFTRMCFNAAVSNSDDHPRNHALLAEGESWRLSPAYDVTPIPSLARDERFLAMACGPLGRLANKNNLIAAAGRFLLSEEEAGQIFERTSQTVRLRWEETMRQCGVSEKDCRTIEPAFLHDGLFHDLALHAR